MSQPYDRVFNFSAGPCTLPVEVLEEARDGLMNYKGTGMSVMEMSHRSPAFEGILAEAEANLRKLMKVPDNYKILFQQGGASMHGSIIAMQFLNQGPKPQYITTGTWGQKSMEYAKVVGELDEIYSGKAEGYRCAPDFDSLPINPEAAYAYFTSNETIQGVQFQQDPNVKATWVCDMSSDILARNVDINKYAIIYAGAQKNQGPAGVVTVIVSDEMLARVPKNMAPMFDYRVQAENDSLYNTPPCWPIYMCGLVYKWVEREGGVMEMNRRNKEKAGLIYKAIDESGGFYKGHAAKEVRSIMNVSFTLPDEELTKKFIKESEGHKLDGLKGHRSVGGIRASIYNAFPKEGCEVLAQFMRDFAARG
jgi:phosphoserine aminotransferase